MTRIRTTDGHCVTIDGLEDGYGDTYKREFTCPENGGYVREWDASRKDWRQVCERLADQGNTLTCRSRDDLAALIRTEWRRSRQFQARVNA